MAPKHVLLVALVVFVGSSALHHERVTPSKNRHAQVASALRKTSLVDAAEAVTNSSYTLAYCVRIITDTADHQSGYLAVEIDGVNVVPSTLFTRGSTVLQQCYATVPTVGISNPTNDGWGGAIEISTDGGTTYESMTCLDCPTATKDTSYIFVDGDGTATSPNTGCVGFGTVCSVSLWGSGSYCVRIITEDYSSQQGDLVVEVDGLTVRDGFFNQGDTVLDRCYPSAPTIKLNNPTNDGWGGNVLASINGGADYSSMICADCISGSDTSYMVVKADGQSSGDTVCAGTTFFCTLHWNTVAPTPAPTSSPTTAAPTVSPTSSPTTAAPTASPTTAAPVPATVGLTGDPHVTNLVGKRFDVRYAGNIMLLQVPRGAEEGSTLLRLDGHTKQVGDVCNNQLYLDLINISGRWSMASNDAPVSIKAKKKAAAAGHPKHKQRFHFGGVLVVLSHAHTDTGITYMNLRVSNLARLKMPVGGLLGEDDYSWAYAMPVECQAAEGEEIGHQGAAIGQASLAGLGTKL